MSSAGVEWGAKDTVVPLTINRAGKRRPHGEVGQGQVPFVLAVSDLDRGGLDVALSLVYRLRQVIGDRKVQPLVDGDHDVRIVDGDEILQDAGQKAGGCYMAPHAEFGLQ